MSEFSIDPILIENTLANTSQPDIARENFDLVVNRVKSGSISEELANELAVALSKIAVMQYPLKIV